MRKLQPWEVDQFIGEWFRAGISDVEELQGGEWSQAFGLHCVSRDLVVRFSDHLDDFQKDSAAAQFRSGALPVPLNHGLDSAFDGYFCVSERAYGRVLETVDGPEMHRLVPAILAMLDALREVDSQKWIDRVGAPTLSWHDQLLSVDEENHRVFGWHDRMAASPTGSEPFRKGLAYLRANIQACPELTHLLHNDLLHNNVLVADDKITGVFDWGCGGLGDFLYELAMFTFYAPWFAGTASIDWKAEAVRHYGEIGLFVPEMDLRLRCNEVSLGLAGMAYAAFKESWDELELNAVRTMSRICA